MLLASIRRDKHVVIGVVFSSIVVFLLEGGWTSHFVFKIPIAFGKDLMCLIPMQSNFAELLWKVKLVIWDEVLAQHCHCVEAVDRILRDIMQCVDSPFGGKVVVFEGDYRQCSPVVSRVYHIWFCGVKCMSWFSWKTWDCVSIPSPGHMLSIFWK